MSSDRYESDWFGVTYQEDKPFVMEKINSPDFTRRIR
jgi:hypothetical protein